MTHIQNPRAKDWNEHLKCAEWFRTEREGWGECKALQLFVNASVQLGLFSSCVPFCPRAGTVSVMSHRVPHTGENTKQHKWCVLALPLWCHSPLSASSPIPWWCSNLYQLHKMVKGEQWDCSDFKDTQGLDVLVETGAERAGKVMWILGREGN